MSFILLLTERKCPQTILVDTRENHTQSYQLEQSKFTFSYAIYQRISLSCIARNPANPFQFALGGNDPFVRIYDKRQPHRVLSQGCFPSLEPISILAPDLSESTFLRQHGQKESLSYLISLCYDNSGTELLASYRGNDAFLFSHCSAASASQSVLPMKRSRDDDVNSDLSAKRRAGIGRIAIDRYDLEQLVGQCSNREELESVALLPLLKQQNAVVQAEQEEFAATRSRAQNATIAAHYTGHTSVDTPRNTCFWGSKQQYVLSGSDDGSIVLWNRYTGDVLHRYSSGRASIVQELCPHPFLPLFASWCFTFIHLHFLYY